MRTLFILALLSASALSSADQVDLTRANYALRLAPQYRRGERPGSVPTPCWVSQPVAASLSRAQDALRLRELFLRITECGGDAVSVALEDRAAGVPRNAASELRSALEGQGLKQDASHPNRFLR